MNNSDMRRANILLTNACNYSCSYCSKQGLIDLKNKSFGMGASIESANKIINFFDKRGKWYLEIGGGEPTVYPYFEYILKKATINHKVMFVTNLSVSKEQIVNLLKNCNINNIDYIQCSLQEQGERNLKNFIEKLEVLKKYNIRYYVDYVATPKRLSNINEIVEIMKNKKIPFSIRSVYGIYNGKEYPQSYSKSEKELFEQNSVSAIQEAIIDIGHREPLGKLCSAGFKSISIDCTDGNIYRCVDNKKDCIGNIYENKLSLKEDYYICNYTSCLCCLRPHKDIEKLTYQDIENILCNKEKYDKYIYKEYKENSIRGREYDNYYKKRLKKIFGDCQDKTVGIYGIGNHTIDLLEKYEKLIGKIDFKIEFITSKIDENDSHTFLGEKVYGYEDIQNLHLNKIIISSYSYQEEIYEKIKDIPNIEIVKIYERNDQKLFG